MLCSVQAGCRQLSELSFFSLLPLTVHTSKGNANRQDLACPVCHREINVLLGWPEGHRVCSGMTAFSSVSSPVLCFPSGLVMQSSWKDFVVAALRPGGDMYYYPFGYWFDPSSEREYRTALWLFMGWWLAPGCKPRGACEWRHSLLQHQNVWWHLYTSLFCRGLSLLCHSWGSSVYPPLVLLLWGFMWDFLWFM